MNTAAAFERGAWEIAQEGTLAKKNFKATEVLDFLGLPRKERKQAREKLLRRADEIADLRRKRRRSAAKKPKTYNDLLRIAEEKILRSNPQDIIGSGYLAQESKRIAQNLRKTDAYEVLLRIARKEIHRRGIGGTGYFTMPYQVYDYDPINRIWLVGSEGYQEYTRSRSYYRKIKWLFGKDDAGYWAVRVPARFEIAYEALKWLIPDEVKAAQKNGRWVARQGDLYIVESDRDNLDELPASHEYNPETRVFTHDRHAPVEVPAHVKAVSVYRQKQVNFSGGKTYAD